MHKIAHMPTDLLSTKQAAERMGVSVSTISRLVASRKLTPALRLEGKTGPMFFNQEDVESAITEAAS
jgi:excisionase family DNA binding protein